MTDMAQEHHSSHMAWHNKKQSTCYTLLNGNCKKHRIYRKIQQKWSYLILCEKQVYVKILYKKQYRYVIYNSIVLLGIVGVLPWSLNNTINV